MSKDGPEFSFGEDWYERMFGDRFKNLYKDIFRESFGGVFQNSFENMSQDRFKFSLPDSVGEVIRAMTPRLEMSFHEGNSINVVGFFDPQLNTTIAKALTNGLPAFTKSLDFGSKRFDDYGLTRLEGLFGSDSMAVSDYARLGAWAVANGADEKRLVDWSAEAAKEDPELRQELDFLYEFSEDPWLAYENIRPTTKPLPVIPERGLSRQAAERLARIGVSLVMAISLVTVAQVVTGGDIYWSAILAQFFGAAFSEFEDDLTEKVAKELQGQASSEYDDLENDAS